MNCPKCQTQIPDNAKFCNECSYALTKDSPGMNKPSSTSYTPKYLADKILTSKSTIEGERKLVTVLFADVANYSTMSEKLDPEEVHRIMDGCFKIIMEEVHKYQGTINQFTGDGVMALFGAPLAHEDHTERACYAALVIQKTMLQYSKELESEFGFTFRMRIGINTGLVVIGSIGDDLRMDYTAIGQTTNLASRMESSAKPGTIFVTQHTFNKVKNRFKFLPRGKLKIKGKENPVEVFQLEDKVDSPLSGLNRKIYSKMVGRDRELDRLELQVMKTINGMGSVVNIIGEAGIGKSRLISELKKKEFMKKVTFLEGKAISIGRNFPFYPIISFLKKWAKIKEEIGESEALAKLETAICNVCQEDVDEILPFVATLMGMKLRGIQAERITGIEGEALEKLIHKNLRELLSKACDSAPVIIVIEDLHWADTSSIELIESLFRLTKTHKILFINVFRPGYRHTGDRVLETVKNSFPVYHINIHLKPLNEQMSETLINNMLNIKGLHHAIKDRVVKRACGNPFFIEEVVRSFIDEGAVVVKHGVFEVTKKIDSFVIPETIDDVLMARIDRLDENNRNLVKLASVIGRNFFYRVLTEVAGTIVDLNERLTHLKEVQLIRERMRSEELEYLFKHALAQEAAYQSILVHKRKTLHLQVADSIEKVFHERLHEFYGMLAYHYSKGEDPDKAEQYMEKAGEEALRSSASSEALHFYQEALKLYKKNYKDAADPEKVIRLEKNIALALFNRGRFEEAIEYFDKILAYYGETLPRNSISASFKFIDGFSNFLIALYIPVLKWKKTPSSRDIEIIHIYYKKLTALTVTDSRRFFIESFYFCKRLTRFYLAKLQNGPVMLEGFIATFSFSGFSFGLSRKVLAFVQDKINEADLKSVLYNKLYTSLLNMLTGDWREEYDDELVKPNLKMGEYFFTSIYIAFHGRLRTEQGMYTETKDLVDKLFEIGNVYENDFTKVLKCFLNTRLIMKYRNLHEALLESDQGIDLAQKTDLETLLFSLYSLKARIQVLRGNINEAENALQHAMKIKSEFDIVPLYQSDFLLSRFTLDLYQLGESIKMDNKKEFAKYRRRARKSGMKTVKNSKKVAHDRPEALKLMGTYYWLIGKQKKAKKLWLKAIKTGEFLNARLELSRTYMTVGKYLLEPESNSSELNGIQAGEYLEKSRVMFEEMGLRHDLEELKKVVSERHSPLPSGY